jgi:diguanylate cyclase (GGDEF)-like protein/PAS domain S-box-containing protein
MRRLPLGTRLALGFFLVAVLPLAGLAWFYLDSFESALRQTVLQNIASIADKKADQIDTFIDERLKDVQALGRNRNVRRIMADLLAESAPPAAATVRARQAELAELIDPDRYHDLLLITPDGKVRLSLRQESDLGSNLYRGPYRDTGLARGFRQALSSFNTDLTPFEPYAPSGGQVSAFLVVPLMSDDRLLGALALQLDIDTLTPVVSDRTGLGQTGETVLAERQGDHLRYTAPLRHIAGATFQKTLPEAKIPAPMRAALAGGHGLGLGHDYFGVPVAAAWRYLPALHWGMVVKMDAHEVFLPAQRARRATALALLAFLGFSGTAALLLGRRLVRSESIITAQEARYRAIFAHMNDGVALYRPDAAQIDFTFIDFNPAAERITGLTRAAVLGQSLAATFPALEEAGVLPAMRDIARGGPARTIGLTHYQDRRLDLWVENDLMRLPGGEVLAVFRDVSARIRAEADLRLYANFFAHSSEALLVADAEKFLVQVNPAFSRITGYRPDEALGRSTTLLTAACTPAATLQELRAALADKGFWQGEIWLRHKNGENFPTWAAISMIRNVEDRLTHYIAGFTDIRAKKAAEERIAHLAHHDALTGLLNRYSLEQRLTQALLAAQREARVLAVLFIDLDRFKAINDTLGHHAGDLLLIAVAERLKAAIRTSDIVARLGGDEFVVVLTCLDRPADATLVAQKILESLGSPYLIDTHTLHSTPSIGISFFPADGANAENLLKTADTAMYRAKELGRNTIQNFACAASQDAAPARRADDSSPAAANPARDTAG